jgi:hypothetical protein
MNHWEDAPKWESKSGFRWKDLVVRCGSPNCGLRLKVQPALLARFRGIQFERRWYHEPACLKDDLLARLRSLLSVGTASPRQHRIPIGLLLVKRGVITPEDLRAALRLQRQAGVGNIGYWLQQVTNLDEEHLCAALSQQWGCPVFPLEGHTAPLLARNAPPYLLLESARAVPAFATLNGHEWHIAFSERIDHTLLYAWEQILQCKTYPCVARGSAVNEALELSQKRITRKEICFDSVRDPLEMASTICSYASQMDARQIKVERAVGHIWAALFQSNARRDLLFRLTPEQSSLSRELLPALHKGNQRADDIGRDGVWNAADTQ